MWVRPCVRVCVLVRVYVCFRACTCFYAHVYIYPLTFGVEKVESVHEPLAFHLIIGLLCIKINIEEDR